MNVNKAASLVKKKNPDKKITICNETKKLYLFAMIPNELRESDGYADGLVYTVNKVTGIYKEVNFIEVIKLPIIKEHNVKDL